MNRTDFYHTNKMEWQNSLRGCSAPGSNASLACVEGGWWDMRTGPKGWQSIVLQGSRDLVTRVINQVTNYTYYRL